MKSGQNERTFYIITFDGIHEKIYKNITRPKDDPWSSYRHPDGCASFIREICSVSGTFPNNPAKLTCQILHPHLHEYATPQMPLDFMLFFHTP